MQKFRPRADPTTRAENDLREAEAMARQLGVDATYRRNSWTTSSKLKQKLEELDEEIAEAARARHITTTAYSAYALRSKLLDPALPQLHGLSADDTGLLGDIPNKQGAHQAQQEGPLFPYQAFSSTGIQARRYVDLRLRNMSNAWANDPLHTLKHMKPKK